jgi:glycosyltransferase involved in cell wall biosynthesis
VPGEPLRIVWSGLHLPGKALNLLLEAMARIERNIALELHVLGDGPLRQRWAAQARRLGLDESCIWHGRVPRKEALRLMGEAHVLAITSLKDLTSTVLLEGLALGLPVVCPDHCGFSDVVNDACGIKVSPGSIESLVSGLKKALLCLEGNEAFRLQMAASALERARVFGLPAKREKLNAVYRDVLSAAERN